MYLEKLATARTGSEELSVATTVDPDLEKRVVRHFDRRVMPWLFGLWLLAFIDRSNIGNARIDGLATDLNLTGKLKTLLQLPETFDSA